MLAWLSQLFFGPPAPLHTCTKRTPRSTSLRASRQLRANAAVGSRAIRSVSGMKFGRLAGQVERLRGGELHLRGQLVALDPRLKSASRRGVPRQTCRSSRCSRFKPSSFAAGVTNLAVGDGARSGIGRCRCGIDDGALM